MEPQRSLRVVLADVPEPDAAAIARALAPRLVRARAPHDERRRPRGSAARPELGRRALRRWGRDRRARGKALALVRLADPHLPFVAITRSVRRHDLAAVVKGLEQAIAVAVGPGEVAETLQR